MSNGRHACSTKKKSMSKTSSAYCLKKWSRSKSDPKLAFCLVFGKIFLFGLEKCRSLLKVRLGKSPYRP